LLNARRSGTSSQGGFGMRSKIWSVARTGAALALIFGVCIVVTGCDSLGGGWNDCGCAPKCAPAAPPCGCAAPQPACNSGNCGAFPANAKPGEAWCCVWVPPVTENRSHQVCTCPEQCNKTWIPPVYETKTKKVCTKEACRTEIPIPAEYNTVEECVEVCPSRTEWQRVPCDGANECWALVTIPPTYEKRQHQVCSREASVRYEEIPPVYEDQCEQVEVACGYYKEDKTPAVYATESECVEVAPGRWEWRLNAACVVPQPQVCNPCVPGQPMGPGPMTQPMPPPGQPYPQPQAQPPYPEPAPQPPAPQPR